MKTLNPSQLENVQGGCSDQEMMSHGATMIILGALSLGTLAILYGAGAAIVCLSGGSMYGEN